MRPADDPLDRMARSSVEVNVDMKPGVLSIGIERPSGGANRAPPRRRKEEVAAQIGEITTKTNGFNDEVENLDQFLHIVLQSSERVELYRQDAQQQQQEAKAA